MTKKKASKPGQTPVQTQKINLSPSPRLHQYLVRLAETNLYEKTPTGVALALVREGVRRAIDQGVIKP